MPDTSFIPKGIPSRLTETRRVSSQPILGRFIVVPGTVLLLSFILAGAIFLYRTFLENRVEELDITLKRVEGQFEAPLITELTYVSKDIETAKELLRSHASFSRVFDFLEDFTHRQVYFTSFSLAASALDLDGVAASYTVLAEQMRLFEESKIVSGMTISNLSLTDKGGVGFNIKLFFDPSVFQYQP